MLDNDRRQLADKGIGDRYESLSEREREIFQLIAEAKANKEIAALLNVSTSTVESHRAHMMEKLDPVSCSGDDGRSMAPLHHRPRFLSTVPRMIKTKATNRRP